MMLLQGIQKFGMILGLNLQMALLCMFVILLMIIFYHLIKLSIYTTKWADMEYWIYKNNMEGIKNDRDITKFRK